MFSYRGPIPSSKSLFIRALVAASYGVDLEVTGDPDSDDISRTRLGLESLRAGGVVDCGEGGAVLRFLAIRASRQPGEHILVGSERLFSRPMKELTDVVAALGAHSEVSGQRLIVTTAGWRATEVAIDCSRSSQFASAVLINSWELEAPLTINLRHLGVSAGYWNMTKAMVAALGMEVAAGPSAAFVAPGQEVASHRYEVEPDMGSAFAVAAAAAVSGEATLDHWPSRSLQPDARFPDVLAAMGVPVAYGDRTLEVARAPHLKGVDVDLVDSPDLFPVLAALAGLADGGSVLRGAPQLRFKESDRIAKVAELVAAMGRDVVVHEDGIEIGGELDPGAEIAFDADQDHRMAMAAAVARQGGLSVDITGGESVAKSFSRFWSILGWQP